MANRRKKKPISVPESNAPPAEKRRDPRFDLIRAAAAYLVLSVHFFMNCGYYTQPMEGKRMFLMTAGRMACMTCVPMFLMLTGALCRKKELNKRYYVGIIRILLTYVLCAVPCLVIQAQEGMEMKAWDVVGMLLEFTAAPYAWYVEMYVGLFFLIPFLNVIWEGLKTRRRRLALIATLLGILTLPTLVNLSALTDLHYAILPDWWIGFYPLIYYFLGAWLGEYPLKIHWRLGVPALAALALAEGGIVFALSEGKPFRWTPFSDWAGAGVTASAFLLFALLRQVPVERFPGWLQWGIRKGSELSLAIYLLSWCFDHYFYPVLAERVPDVIYRLPWYIVIVPAVYICSALAAQVVEWIRMVVTLGWNRLFPKFQLK